MRLPCAALLLFLASPSCAATAEEPPAPPPPPAPDPAPPTEEAPAEAPVAPEGTSPEARALLERAAARQGSGGLVGAKAVTRFLARFDKVRILDPAKGKHQLDRSTQAFAARAAPAAADRVRSEGTANGETTILGHNGRFGWVWTRKDGGRAFVDPEKDRADIAEVGDRGRMLRLALRVFFLGGLAGDRVPVRLLPDEKAALPVGDEGRSRRVDCRVLERAADPDAGEGPVRILLDAGTLDPAAALFPASGEKEPGWLLVLDYGEDVRPDPARVPKDLRVPGWIEMFEVPADPAAKPILRIQASVDGLEIDPAKVPDTLFQMPK
jgi:hypothetical protein